MSSFANLVSDFVEVFIHKGALDQRTKYINGLKSGDESMLFA